MIRLFGIFALILFLFKTSIAQRLTYERMSVYAYEDMSDWIRRFPGMYPMDYGVAGAPVTFQPWGLQSWYIGAERDGIPWHRVSDGLYDSNLDSPEELESLTLDYFGSSPLATLKLSTRDLVTDTATTVIRLREGYYGFGRVDFAHAQKLSSKVSAESRGRLWWYDGLRVKTSGGLRESTSMARFYNLSGKLSYQINESWRTKFEYGGANVDAQSPTTVLIDSTARRPDVYSEREYGTARVEMTRGRLKLDAGLHARQDREVRDFSSTGLKLFGLQEQYMYGFLGGAISTDKSRVETQIGYEDVSYIFPGVNATSENAIRMNASAEHDLKVVKLKGRYLFRKLVDKVEQHSTFSVPNDESVAAQINSQEVLGLSLIATGNISRKSVPEYWQSANLPISYRNLLVDSAFASEGYYGGRWTGFEAENNAFQEGGVVSGGIHWQHASSSAQAGWTFADVSQYRFLIVNDTAYFYSNESRSHTWQGPTMECDVALTYSFRFQSWSSVECDKNGFSRALDTRTFSRVLFARDFFKSPLHIESYVAYELLGRRRVMSDIRDEVIGPAHLLHLRIEATIEGVTLIWGAENLTGQHYEYLPGYLMIRKEEYFGLKWTLKL